MTDPLRIAVLGAGGLGGYLAAVLFRAGQQVSVIARGDHGVAIHTGGLRVSDPEGDFVAFPEVISEITAGMAPDILLVTVKAHSLSAIVDSTAIVGQRGTIVIPLLNGVEAPSVLIHGGVPLARLAPGVAYVTSFLTGPGHVSRQGGYGRLILGVTGPEVRPSLERLRDGFEAAGIVVDLTDQVEVELWRKMMVVCALTAACGITNSSVGAVRSHEWGQALFVQAVEEVVAVGRGKGIGIGDECQTWAIDVLQGFPDGFYPSLIHDLRRGQATEVRALNGAIARLGREVGVATPIHDAATCAIELFGRGLDS